MKKLLYIVPLLLLGLCVSSLSLYKDNVDYAIVKNPNAEFTDIAGAFTQLSPSHWKMIDYQVSGSANLGDSEVFVGSDEEFQKHQAKQQPKVEPVSQGAKFYGFPVAAYFSKNSSTQTANSSSSVTASAYSYLWVAIDLLLIIGSLVVAVLLNRKKKIPTTSAQPFTPQASENTTTVPPVSSQSTIVQPTVVAPAQPTGQPSSQVFSPRPNAESADKQDSNS